MPASSAPVVTASGPSPTPTPSEPSESSTSPSVTRPSTSSPSPSSSATDGPAVKATGSLKLYAPASGKLAGTCRNTAGNPTIAVADRKNDFFHTINAVLVLDPTRKSVSKLTIDLGEDSELITRTLSYDAAKPAAGSSATMTSKGSTYKVTGKLASQEDGKDAGTMPVTLTVVCAGRW